MHTTLGTLSKTYHGSRKCGLQVNAVNIHFFLGLGEGSGTDGQEHHENSKIRKGTWKTTQLWRNCGLISRIEWTLCSPRTHRNQRYASCQTGANHCLHWCHSSMQSHSQPRALVWTWEDLTALGIMIKVSGTTLKAWTMCPWLKLETKWNIAKTFCWTYWVSLPFPQVSHTQQMFDQGSVYNSKMLDTLACYRESKTLSVFVSGLVNPKVVSPPHPIISGSQGYDCVCEDQFHL